jgi:hypothetical protein
VPPKDRGLLARLDALVALAADRHGLALLPDGRLAAAEARVAGGDNGVPLFAPAAGLAGSTSGRGRTAVERDAVELLRCVAEGVGLLRVRGDRLEATSLRHAWSQIDESLRAGLTFATWCHGVHWSDCGPWVQRDVAEPAARRSPPGEGVPTLDPDRKENDRSSA